MWTQGETNANSVWMPTVDAPNEQFTQEILITTDNGYNTLSNGVLVASTQNSDGTRTDHWEQKKAHSPYLAMMAIGQFHIAQEQWGAIDVTYYTQEEYSRDGHQNIRSNHLHDVIFLSALPGRIPLGKVCSNGRYGLYSRCYGKHFRRDLLRCLLRGSLRSTGQ